MRRGVVTAGTWCVDLNKSIPAWPAEDTMTYIVDVDRQGGGSGCNMAIDLKRLDPDLPVATIALVGDDPDGRFLIALAETYGIDHARMQTTDDAYLQADSVVTSPRVSGYVDQVFVADNQHVKAGDPLIRIDPRDLQAKVDQEKASVAYARSQARGASAGVPLVPAGITGAALSLPK